MQSASSVGGVAAAALEMLCIADEAVRLWLAGCSEQERGWVLHRELESLLGLMHEVESLRVPLVFGRAHTHNVTQSEGGTVGGAVATKTATDYTFMSAASKAVMRSGRHFARFTVKQGNTMMFGVLRPGWDVEGGRRTRTMWTATASTGRTTGAACPATATGRASRKRGRATASVCCSTSTRAA